MSTKAHNGRQAKLWDTLSGYDLDIVYRAGKKNRADAPSRQPDYMLGALLQHGSGEMPAANRRDSNQHANTYTPRVMHAIRVFKHLLAAATLEDEPFAEVPPDTLKDMIKKSHSSDSMAEEARLALRPLGIQPVDNRLVSK